MIRENTICHSGMRAGSLLSRPAEVFGPLATRQIHGPRIFSRSAPRDENGKGLICIFAIMTEH